MRSHRAGRAFGEVAHNQWPGLRKIRASVVAGRSLGAQQGRSSVANPSRKFVGIPHHHAPALRAARTRANIKRRVGRRLQVELMVSVWRRFQRRRLDAFLPFLAKSVSGSNPSKKRNISSEITKDGGRNRRPPSVGFVCRIVQNISASESSRLCDRRRHISPNQPSMFCEPVRHS